ncbi:MAG: ATP-binding protein [Candidatus Eremiobacterota bacterium]
MRWGVRAKLFVVSLALIGLSLLASEAVLTSRLEPWLTDQVRAGLFPRLALITAELEANPTPADRAGWDRLADRLGRPSQARLTLIAPDGTVLGDSELGPEALSTTRNHSDRPEFEQALGLGRGSSTRASATLGRRMLYAAVPFHRNGRLLGVARLAVPLTEIDGLLSGARRILVLSGLMGLAVALLMSSLASQLGLRRLRELAEAARRMAAGDLSIRTRSRGEDELALLGQDLDQLAASLSIALQELRTDRDLLSGILHSMREGVLLLDAHNRIIEANPAMESMLGPGGARGQLLLEGIRNPNLQELVERVRRTGEASDVRLECPPLHCLVRARRLAVPADSVLVVMVDVTDLRRLEIVRRDFVANVSHELRTPLTAILSGLETLRHADAAMGARLLEIVERNARRMHRLVEDLLDLARIESGARRLRMETVEVGRVVRQVMALHAARAVEREIALEAEVPADLRVHADEAALEQVLDNLIDNALKYSDPGGRVTVGAEDRRIWVRDDGPGIDPAQQARLFERFYRVDAGRSRERGGTGLGLAIVRHLVEAMGGFVSVESHPGRGSTFSFTLPSPDCHTAAIST